MVDQHVVKDSVSRSHHKDLKIKTVKQLNVSPMSFCSSPVSNDYLPQSPQIKESPREPMQTGS